MPKWVAAIQRAATTGSQEAKLRKLESATLISVFDAIVITLDSGSTSNLDASIQALLTKQLGQDCSLSDLFYVVNSLKRAIWDTAQKLLPANQALETLSAVEPIFAHSAARLAWLTSQSVTSHLKEELENSQFTLARLDRTKSDFITLAAHELRTPLTLIQGYSAMLASELIEQQELQGIMQGLTNGIQRLQTLIQNMIDVSLIDSDILTLSLEPTSLYEVVRLAVDDVNPEASGRSLSIKVGRFPAEVNVMYLDAKRMYQVFLNIVSNAVKYTPDDGSVTVEARVLSGPEPDLDFIKVSVVDTGIGIAPEDLPHIFRKFYRVGDIELYTTSTTRFKGGGPGLGLAIANGIVNAHGGMIWAESPGYSERLFPGSTFHIVLPINSEAPKSAPERLEKLESERKAGSSFGASNV